jgi:hypothetical protein
MIDQATQFVGGIPENYDRGLGPHVFVDYAADLARRVASERPSMVLELAAGTGIVTRMLRDEGAERPIPSGSWPPSPQRCKKPSVQTLAECGCRRSCSVRANRNSNAYLVAAAQDR